MFLNGIEDIRDNYTKYLGEDKMKRILSKKTSEDDEVEAAQAVIHYGEWDRREFTRNLSIKNKLRWYFVARPDYMYNRIETVLALGAGIGIAITSLKKIKNGKFKKNKEK